MEPPTLTDAESELLQLPDKTESNIRSYIRTWLKELGADISSKWRTSAEPIDLYLKNRRVVIETKIPRRLSKLATRAEKVAKACPKQDGKSIREFLREDGVAGEIDDVVKELLPEYTM